MLSTREISIRLRAGVSELVGPMKQAEASVVGFGQKVETTFANVEHATEQMKKLWTAMFEAFIGIEIGKKLTELADGANRAKDAMEIAANTAHNLGKAFDAAAMEKWLDTFAMAAEGGGYAVTEMRDSVQQFAAVGASDVQVKRLMGDATLLAAGRNMDLKQATYLVTMAAAGHVSMLSRYGIQVKDASGKTVDFTTAMQRLEKAFAGDAQKRAEGLDGALGRLGVESSFLGDIIGNHVAPVVGALANTLTHLIDAFNKLPKPIQDIIIDSGLLTAGLTILVTLLPAIAKGVGFVGEGFKLAKGIILDFTDLLAPLARGLAFASQGMFDLAAAELAPIAPIAAIVAAIIALIAIITELVRHMDHVQTAWHDWTNYLSSAFDEFVNNVRSGALDLKTIMGDVIELMSPNAGVQALARQKLMYDAAPKSTVKYGAKLDKDMGVIGNDTKRDAAGLMHWIGGLFSGAFGSVDPGKASLKGLGDIAKKGKPGKGDLAQNEDRIATILDASKSRTAIAEAQYSEAQAHAKSYTDSLDPKKDRTPQEVAKQQQLARAEMEAQLNVQRALNSEQQVTNAAAGAYHRLLQGLKPDTAAHVKQIKTLAKHWEDAKKSALQLQAKRDGMNPEADFAHGNSDRWQALAVQQADKANAAIQAALGLKLGGIESARSGDAQAGRMSELGLSGTDLAKAHASDNVHSASYALRQVNAEMRAATDEWANTQKTLKGMSQAEQRAALDAHNATMRALGVKLDAANNELDYRRAEKTKVEGEGANRFFDSLTKLLASKVPGLEANENAKGGMSLGFSPVAMLIQAISQTKAFGDVMRVVTQLMRILAQIFDSFRPVIDALLKGVEVVANGFISLWNVMARILGLFGIHVAILQKLNGDFSDAAAPFIQFIHDIPTLNELASGHIAPLRGQNNDYYKNNITNPLTDTLNGPDLGGGLLGVLGDILAGILALKLAMGLFGGGGGGGIVGNVMSLFGGKGGGGGIVSTVGKLLGLGGAAAGPSLATMQGLEASNAAGGSYGAFTSQAGGSGGSGGLGALLGGAHLGAATLGSALLAAAGGAILGGGIGMLEGGGSHTSFGALGGAAGGTLGATLGMLGMAGGPMGALAGALLGGVIGGLFGHADNKAAMPDKYANGYGQDLANLQGSGVYMGKAAMNANGQSYTESGQVSTALQGMGEMQYIAQWIESSGGKGLTAQQKALFTGENVKDTIVGGKDGNFDLANGQHVQWQTLVDQANAAITTIAGQMQNMGDTVGGNLANATANIAGQAAQLQQNLSAAGNEMAGRASGVNGTAPAMLAAVAGALGSAGGGAHNTLAPSITNHFNGDIHGYNDVEQIGKDLAESTARYSRIQRYGFGRAQAE